MQVGVVGAGYVGLTTAAVLAYVGHSVVCVDTDTEKLKLLEDGKVPFFEPGLGEMLRMCRHRIVFTSEYQRAVNEASVLFVCVGTPPLTNGESDVSYVDSACAAIAENAQMGTSLDVVLKSTVPVGTNERLSTMLSGHCNTQQVKIVSCPEFLREGSALSDALFPDRIVIGANDANAAKRVLEILRPIVEGAFASPSFVRQPDKKHETVPVLVTDYASAEMIKYASNAFLAVKISFINQIANLADQCGGAIHDIAKGMGLDARIGHSFLSAGVGWGGSCFPKDVDALIALGERHGVKMTIARAARHANRDQRMLVGGKLVSMMGSLFGKTIVVLGFAFKPGTDDTRESPAIDVVRLLVSLGAHVRLHDPVALPRFCATNLGAGVKPVHDVWDALTEADAVVIVTDWREYRDLDWACALKRMRGDLLVDGRNCLDADQMVEIGFRYVGFGCGVTSRGIGRLAAEQSCDDVL